MTIDKTMSNEEYHRKLKGISSTRIKDVIARNVGHAMWKAEPENNHTTDALIRGTAMHSAILTPDRFGDEIIPMIDCDSLAVKNGDEAKDWIRERNKTVPKDEKMKLTYKTVDELYAAVAEAGGPRQAADIEREYRARHIGRTIVSKELYDESLEIGRAVRSHPTSAALLTHGEPEVSMWVERDMVVDTGQGPRAVSLTLKVRPDWYDNELRVRVAGIPPKRLILSVKTSRDASQGKFSRDAANMLYYVSESYYVDVVSAATGTDPSEWMVMWLVVDTSGEFQDRIQSIAHYYLSDEEIDAGRWRYEKALDAIAVARLYEAHPVMGGYPWQAQPAKLPRHIHYGGE